MQTLQIDKSNARKLFPSASKEFKQMLIDSFGETFFSQKITDRVKTFEDACEVLDVNPTSLLNKADSVDEIAYRKLKVIAKALNEGWTPDWNNSSEYKYYPWFTSKGGFVLNCVYCTSAGSDVSSRLCFRSRELTEYAAKQFVDLYKDFFTL